jgi:hypothetical protein
MSAYYQHKARVLFPRKNLPAQPQKRDYPANTDYVRALSKWADEEAEARQHNSDVMAKRAHFLKEKLHAKERPQRRYFLEKLKSLQINLASKLLPRILWGTLRNGKCLLQIVRSFLIQF